MDGSPWARLIRCSKKEDEYFPVLKCTHTIGRKPECDVMVSDHRVSGLHCVLVRRGKKGEPAIKDVSSNGTLLNGKKMAKRMEVALTDGDCITVVLSKEDPEHTVAFKFVDLRSSEEMDATLSYEEDGTQEDALTEEATVRETLCQDHVDGDTSSKKGKKRPLEDADKSVAAAKIPATDSAVTGVTEPGSSKSGDGNAAIPSLLKKDSIEEALICQICQEILHDCISLQPCMHCYCGGCYSDWMGESNTCPACRKTVIRIGKNHTVNNLVDAYLRANPDKKRPEEDLKDLDVKNKITSDIDYTEAVALCSRRSGTPSDLSDTSSDSSPSPMPVFAPYGLSTYGLSTYIGGLAPMRCMQCPGSPYRPVPYPFTCTSTTLHVYCTCCRSPMPVRNDDPSITQKCTLCNSYYCFLYWSCRNPSCVGCLNKFKDINLPSTCLNGILGNAYESNILKEHIERKGWSIRGFIQDVSELLESGTLSAVSHGITLTSDTIVCAPCATSVLERLAYDYRRAIPNDELPLAVTTRTDCYWGRECRTQFTNPSHARRYNHVCEKTRTS